MLKILEELEDDNVDNIKGGALNMAIFFLIKLHILNLQFYIRKTKTEIKKSGHH